MRFWFVFDFAQFVIYSSNKYLHWLRLYKWLNWFRCNPYCNDISTYNNDIVGVPYSLLNLEIPDLGTLVGSLANLRELYLDGVNVSLKFCFGIFCGLWPHNLAAFAKVKDIIFKLFGSFTFIQTVLLESLLFTFIFRFVLLTESWWTGKR